MEEVQRKVYHYSVIRFVPNPVREEAINLGVVLLSSETGYVNCRLFHQYKTRVRSLAPRFDLKLIEAFTEDLQNLMGGVGFQRYLDSDIRTLDLHALQRLADTHANQIQFTQPRAYLAEDPDEALDELFEQLVRPRRSARRPRDIVDRQRIRTEVGRFFTAWKLEPQTVVPRAQIEGYNGLHSFDYGLRNGTFRAALHAVSFQMADIEDVALHRDHVAWAAHDIHKANEEFMVVAVVTPPLPQTERLYGETRKMLDQEGAIVTHLDEFEGLRDRLVRTLFS